jgi:hypothetical protein
MTADNATNMDTLSEHLAHQVPSYSTVNRTRCFLHILNLVAKSLLRQFDVIPCMGTDGLNDNLSDEEEELLNLANGIEEEELTTALRDEANDDEEASEEDNDDGWVNEADELSEEEQAALKVHIRPVSRVLVKVRNLKQYLPR